MTRPGTAGAPPRESAGAALQPAQHATGPVQRLAALLLVGPGRYARAFENLILGLIVLSVASIGVEAIPTLPAWATRALRFGEVAVVTVFSLEYLLRVVAAKEKLRFILSFEGLVDLAGNCARLFTSPASTRAGCGRCAC